MASYKPCTHPHLPTFTHTHPNTSTPSQKKVTLIHTHSHLTKERYKNIVSEFSTVESFAFFLWNYNRLNQENLILSLILLIAKIYSAKLAVFRFANRENLFRKNFRQPKFLPLRYWYLLIYWYQWLLEFLTNLIT